MTTKYNGKENLVPATKETARERGRAGGKASGAARREKRRFRELIELALEGVTPDGLTIKEGIAATAVMKARAGDLRAMELIIQMIGEQPVVKVEVASDLTGAMDEMDHYMDELWNKEQKDQTSVIDADTET